MTNLEFYSREDIQEELIRISKNREVHVWFGEKRGKRPDILQFKGDILELARQGATSFHVSEERWQDPLQLKPAMSNEELKNLRSGFDIVLDIDSKNLEYSKIATKLLIDALKFYNIKNISLKFSGNKGFHIGIPFEALPNKLKEEDIKNLFPKVPREIATYLKEMISNQLKDKLKIKDPFTVVDIDPILISNRHLFRAPYSLHEKTGLVSLPIDPEHILDFNVEQANPENVKVNLKFLDTTKESDASQLVTQVFDFIKPQGEISVKERREFKIPETVIGEEYFPSCIKQGLNGLEDGRKRFLFVLINFLRSLNWDMINIENLVNEWNKKNKTTLSTYYIKTQLEWHKKQPTRLPPNCNNTAYYSAIGIQCNLDNICKIVKNPVNYSLRKLRLSNLAKKQPKTRGKTKTRDRKVFK